MFLHMAHIYALPTSSLLMKPEGPSDSGSGRAAAAKAGTETFVLKTIASAQATRIMRTHRQLADSLSPGPDARARHGD